MIDALKIVTIKGLSELRWVDQAKGVFNVMVDDGTRPPFLFTYVPNDKSPHTLAIKEHIRKNSYKVGAAEDIADRPALKRYRSLTDSPETIELRDVLNGSSDDIDSWVSNTVNNLADARKVLRCILKVMALKG